MNDPIEIARRVLQTLSAAGRGPDFLLARMFAVFAMGTAAVPMISHVASAAFAPGGDAAIVAAGALRTFAGEMVDLATVGRDVLVFLGLF